MVIHTTDGTFDGTLAWFASPESRVSAHYLVGLDGRIVDLVDEADTAFHAGRDPRPELSVLGDDPPNLVTIGIEFDDDRRPHDIERPDAQYRAGALLLADIAERWDIPLDRDHVLAHHLINRAKTCPGNLDIDRLLAMAAAPVEANVGTGPRLVVLVPARNAAKDLPGWLESVERFADAVVALDDGSTDDTAAVLEAHPLVEVVLRNPVRESYVGWDDGANRNRLLAAAAALEPDWILSLDADERIPADDAVALREFLATDALPGLAYGFQCFRMWDEGCDPSFGWVYRLFAASGGQRFPDAALHFDPVPLAIGRDRHVRTSLRIQHWGSADEPGRQSRIAKYQEADAEGRYPTGHGGLYEVPALVEPWSPRRSDGPVVLEGRPKADRVKPAEANADAEVGRGPRLVVLVPARNAAEDLPGWLESVERFADAVVALDDGSTDDTAAVLEAHPLVEVVLRNPRRESYVGWDDGANRNRLLAAAAALEPDWILSLDADERIPADDAVALREFLATDALPGLAYGMRCYRMIDDVDHYDRNALCVYRLFAHALGQEMPATRLHFVPIPTSIPRDRWFETTIRIQHLSSLTAERRVERLAKYRQADPDVEFQDGYDHLIQEPTEVFEFGPRPPGLPVLAALAASADSGSSPTAGVEDEVDRPVLSAIIISKDDEDRIERAVRSVVDQQCDDPFEVIVVTSGTDRTAAIVRKRFPEVRLVELDHPALPGEARNAGLRFARGDYISFPGSHVELLPGSLAARIHAHDQGWSMVTGTTYNGTHTAAGWAAYFLDNSSVLPGRPSAQLPGAPAHCSYEARPLLALGGFPDDVRAGEDTRVNEALFRSGHSAFRAADLPLVHHNRSRGPVHLARHHFQRGRAQVQFFRATSAEGAGDARARKFLWAYPTRRLARIDRSVSDWGGDLGPRYRRVRPLVRLGVLAAWVGAHVELRRPTPLPGGATEAEDVRRDTGRGEVLPLEPAPIRASMTPLRRPLRVSRSRPARFAGARAIFLHIPKTAGTTLYRMLEREYAEAPSFRLYGDIDSRLSILAAMDEDERRRLRLVGGHMGFGVDRYLPGPSAYLTMLRDPVDRIVSDYHYVLAHPDDEGHPRALEGVSSLEDYVRSSVFAGIVNNGQARLLGSDVAAAGDPADRATLDRAKAVIDRHDVVVGVQDRFDESLLLMVRAFGWGYPAFRNENVTRTRPRAADLPPSTVELIREANALDVELYEHACRRFDADLEEVEGLDDELELLRLAGRWWEPIEPKARRD